MLNQITTLRQDVRINADALCRAAVQADTAELHNAMLALQDKV